MSLVAYHYFLTPSKKYQVDFSLSHSVFDQTSTLK